MIRINLLGVPRPKRGKRGSAAAAVIAPGVPGEGPGAILFLVAGLVLGLGAFGFFYWSAASEGEKLQKELQAAVVEGQRLSAVKVKYEQRKKEAESFEKRVKVIDQLRAAQAGPVELLNTIGISVNNTDAVWLTSMTESATRIDLEGMALSTQAVANLMTTLKRSGYFKSIEIKEATQDASNKEMTAFIFILSCEKQART